MSIYNTAPCGTTQHQFWIPAGFDALSVIPHKRRGCEDATNYTMHRLVTAFGEDGVSLRFEYMAPLFGGNSQWSDCRKALINDGHMIELNDGAYIIGVHSKRYWPSPRWSDAELISVLCRNASLLAMLRQWEQDRAERECWLPIHFWLQGMLPVITIDIDAIDPAIRDTKHIQWALKRFASNPSRASVTPYGRFNSIVTSMPRGLRRAMRIGGDEVVELDISGAKPLILAFLARCDHTGRFVVRDQVKLGVNERKKAKNKKKPAKPTQRTQPESRHKARGAFAPLLSPSRSTYSDTMIDEPESVPKDLEHFTSICEQGNIYEHLGAMWGIDPVCDRDMLKGKVYRTLLFGHVPRKGWVHEDGWDCYGAWLEFASEYPTLTDYLCRMKLGTRDHAVVARVAQRFEAWLMLEQICGRIKDELPGVAIATIHDGIAVGRPYASAVETIMREEWRAIGLNPMIKRK